MSLAEQFKQVLVICLFKLRRRLKNHKRSVVRAIKWGDRSISRLCFAGFGSAGGYF